MSTAIDTSSRRKREWARTVVAIVLALLAGGLVVFQTGTAEDLNSPAVPGVIQMTPGEATLIKDQMLARATQSDARTGNEDAILFKDSLQTSTTVAAKSHAEAFAEKDRIESGAGIDG